MRLQAEQVKKRRSIKEAHGETEASGHNLAPTPARQNQKKHTLCKTECVASTGEWINKQWRHRDTMEYYSAVKNKLVTHSTAKKSTQYMRTPIQNSRKRKFTYNDRKQINVCVKERITMIHTETFGGDKNVCYLDCGEGFLGIYTDSETDQTTL